MKKRSILKRFSCLVLLSMVFLLTACGSKSFLTLEIERISSTKIHNIYTFTADKEVETWELSIAGTNARFYVNDVLIEEKKPQNGSSSCSMTLKNLSFEKGDVCLLVVIGDGFYAGPATFGIKINGENIVFQ